MLRPRSRPPTLGERLIAYKARLENKAAELKPGLERDDLLKKARQTDIASDLDDWINSPGLQPPK